MRIFKLLLLAPILIQACSNEPEKQRDTGNSFYCETINIDVSNISSPPIESIFDKIEIIPLSSEIESFFGQMGLITTYEGRLFFRDMARRSAQAYCFSENGKFQWKVGKTGKGPGEITGITDMWINPFKNSIEIYDRNGHRKVSYTLNGELIHSQYFRHFGVNLLPINEQFYVSNTGASYNTDDNVTSNENLLILDTLGNIQKSFFPATTPSRSMKYSHWQQLYNFQDSISFWFNFEDTVYRIIDNTPLPRFIFDFGQNKTDQSLITDDVVETHNILNIKGQAHSSRVMCETPTFLILGYTLSNDLIYIIYSKESKKYIQFKDTKTPIKPKSYVPMNFSMCNSDIIYLQIHADKFIEQFPDFIEKSTSPKYRNTFLNIHSDYEITEDSNPILLKCSLKRF